MSQNPFITTNGEFYKSIDSIIKQNKSLKKIKDASSFLKQIVPASKILRNTYIELTWLEENNEMIELLHYLALPEGVKITITRNGIKYYNLKDAVEMITNKNIRLSFSKLVEMYKNLIKEIEKTGYDERFFVEPAGFNFDVLYVHEKIVTDSKPKSSKPKKKEEQYEDFLDSSSKKVKVKKTSSPKQKVNTIPEKKYNLRKKKKKRIVY